MSLRDLQRKFKKQFSDFFEIPRDIMLDLPKIVLVGNLQVFIENHRGIVEYTVEKVRIKVGEGEVGITGHDLMLRNIKMDEICVEGHIKSLCFLEPGEVW
ncbi:sporulation protein YqfC [Desulforamulus aeronauticus]|uniref:Sporulation protein YqfC n=1 Tax=Desulforamulus aeronauticus DSM 10349 TaxID=1121421 RepID=A0A1M6VE10_9FIRM|nr:sporulation protein YqfC [Desulforamulus aeronauticus]SHK79611.1 sporulation protein YqfC [Desulforamulus aeronauticus DSM 10349]